MLKKVLSVSLMLLLISSVFALATTTSIYDSFVGSGYGSSEVEAIMVRQSQPEWGNLIYTHNTSWGNMSAGISGVVTNGLLTGQIGQLVRDVDLETNVTGAGWIADSSDYDFNDIGADSRGTDFQSVQSLQALGPDITIKDKLYIADASGFSGPGDDVFTHDQELDLNSAVYFVKSFSGSDSYLVDTCPQFNYDGEGVSAAFSDGITSASTSFDVDGWGGNVSRDTLNLGSDGAREYHSVIRVDFPDSTQIFFDNDWY